MSSNFSNLDKDTKTYYMDITATSVITGLTIAGVGGASYKVITDYDKIKKKLKSISEDIKGLWIKITHRKNKNKQKDDFSSEY